MFLRIRRTHWPWVFALVFALTTFTFYYLQADLVNAKVVQWTESDTVPSPAPYDGHNVLDDVEVDPYRAPGPKESGRILVVGGMGMLGKQLIRRLLDAGKSVTLYDEVVYPDEIDAIRKAHPKGNLIVTQGRSENLRADLPKALTRDVVGIVNLGGVTRIAECAADVERCRRLNVEGAKELLNLSAKRVRWFIEASTTEVTVKAGEGLVNELAQTKLDVEEWLKAFATDNPSANVHAAALRFATIYGSVNDHPDRMALSFVRNALSHRTIQMVAGHQTVDMLHVTDAVTAIVMAMNHLAAKSGRSSTTEIFTVAPNKPITVKEIIEKVMALTRSKSPLQTIPRDGMYPEVAPDSSAGTPVPGWQAKVTIDDGIKRLATKLTEETVAFLRRKKETTCHVQRHWSMKDLIALNGCSGSLAMDNNGFVAFAHIKEGQEHDGQWPDPESVWRETDMPTDWTFDISKSGRDVELRLTGLTRKRKNNTEVVFEDHTFRVKSVDPGTGNLELSLSTGAPYVPPKVDDDWENAPADTGLSTSPQFRLTPWCCPNKSPGWAFFEDDPLSSFIMDERTDYRIHWGRSRRDVFCDRVQRALDLAEDRLNVLKTTQIPLTGTELPSSLSGDWKSRKDESICTNLCDHPTVCVDTGDCMCVESACPTRSRLLPSPPTWRHVLRPNARRYFNLNPDLPRINVTRVPAEIEKQRLEDDPDHFDRLQTEWHGCYSADSVNERAAKMVSKPFEPDTMVFLPHWEYTLRFPPIVAWAKEAAEKHLPESFYWGLLQIPFTFDWGRCNTVLHHLTNVREKSKPAEELRLASAWQPMGDLNSPCYEPDQDVLIPPRTCKQDELREAFRDASSLKRSADRSVLATFKGSPNGQGTSLRLKVTCPRAWVGAEPVWGHLPEGQTYIELLGNTRFCPVPFGTAGWTYRLSDAVFAGCIPVLIGDQSHLTFWDVLDWSQFSVTVFEHELERLESVLASIPPAQVQRKQDALLLVREAFMYPSEGHIGDAVLQWGVGRASGDTQKEDQAGRGERNGPFFYAMHSAHLVQKTRFYAQWPWHRDE